MLKCKSFSLTVISIDQFAFRMEEGRVAVEDRSMKRALLLVNCILLSVGTSGGPLITRLYFLHGGKHVWLSSFLQSAGFPIILIPLAISYFRRRRHSAPAKLIFMKLPLFFASAIIGIITGLINYLYAYGLSRLPVSTSSLIIATQLAFTAGFAFLLVRQNFTAYSVNAVVLLTIGAAILAMRSTGDRPAGESTKKYVLGFVMTLVAAALNGFVLPLVEWVYKNTRQPITYTLVMEIQLILCFFATLFCTVGMLINNDFKVIGREARDYELGKAKYWVLLVGNAIIWQNFFLGAIGVVFCASSLLSGILVALVLPVTEVLAVILYKEKFQAEKIVALIVSLWGFVSYFWGEIKQSREKRQNPTLEIDLPQTLPDP